MPDQDWFYAQADQSIGPVSKEHLLAQLNTGAIPRNALVWREGFSDWVAANELPELEACLAQTFTPTHDARGGLAIPPPPQSAYTPPGARTGNEPLALISLILSVLGFCASPAALAGVVCGHIALSRIKKNQALEGRSRAMAGLVIGYIVIAINVLLLIVFTLAALTTTAYQ